MTSSGDPPGWRPSSAAPHPKVAGQSATADDRELVARMSAGDDTALAACYDRWSQTTYGLVAHLVRDGDDAEDVLEDTFWQLWRQASRYGAARGDVGTWVLTMARRRAHDRVGARRRLREEPLTPVMLGDRELAAGAGDEDPAHRAEWLERRARVIEALRALPPDERQVLELAFFSGLSQAEIATRIGQPVATVQGRIRGAAQRFSERLAGQREAAAP